MYVFSSGNLVTPINASNLSCPSYLCKFLCIRPTETYLLSQNICSNMASFWIIRRRPGSPTVSPRCCTLILTTPRQVDTQAY